MIWQAIVAAAFLAAAVYSMGTGLRDYLTGRYGLGAVEFVMGWCLMLVAVAMVFVKE